MTWDQVSPSPDQPVNLSYLQEQIETRRNELGLSMRALSMKAGLNETAVKAVMQGRSESPRGKTLQALARALGTTVRELIGETAEPESAVEGLRERQRQLEIESRVIAARLEEVRDALAALCRHTE